MSFYMLEDPYAYRTARNIVEIGSFAYPTDFGADKRDARAGCLVRMTLIYGISRTRSGTSQRP